MTATASRLRRLLLPLLAGAAAAALPGCATTETAATAPAHSPWRGGMAIQLYSFHQDLDRDLAGTLKRIKALGFDRVETYPVANLSAAQLRAALDAAGLKAVSAHLPWDRIRTDLPGVIADAKTLGVEQFGPGSINLFDGRGFRNLSLADAEEAGRTLKQACAAARDAGLRVFIHTHGNEFPAIKGTTPLERMSRTADNCFDIEADLTWVKWAGTDPAALIRQYGARVTSLHLKDVTQAAIGQEPGKIDPKNFPIIGLGTIDWPAVMRASAAAGVRHYIIEDESADPAGQIPHSLEYLDSIAGD
jgi:sugar phosphate isomerase/epimerase